MHKFVLALLAVAATALSQTPGRTFLNEGVAAYKAARYAQAVELFQQAANASPADPVPRLYLATAYMSQFIPGADSPENLQFASNAEREFQTVLAIQPGNMVAMESLASLSYQQAMGNSVRADKLRSLDEAANWYQKIVSAQPDNKAAYYSLGVIAWAKFYPELMQARQKLGMRPEDPGPLSDAAARADLRSRLGQTVEEGMRNLERALELDPAYDDAMAYLNLLYRERADLYDTTAEYQRDVVIADEWVRRALDTKKAKAPQFALAPSGGPTQGTIVFERQQTVGGPIPAGVTSGIIGGILYAPPPPPPPPPPPRPHAEPVQQPDTPKRIRVSGDVQAQNLIEKPEPDYPALARQARIQGTVRFNATILKDGTIGNLTLVSGHPLLASSATEAARRYIYKPTFLNGEPVEVVTQIDVSFQIPFITPSRELD